MMHCTREVWFVTGCQGKGTPMLESRNYRGKSKERGTRMLSKTKQVISVKGVGVAALVMGGLLFQTSNAQAQTPAIDPAKVLKGLQIAPVPLNMVGKDVNLVGYGSYLVNANGDCNGCHSAGPQTQYATGGNPYFGQHPAVENPVTYLGGT